MGARGGRAACRRRQRSRPDLSPADRSRARDRGKSHPRTAHASGRRARVLRHVLGRGPCRAADHGRGLGTHGRDDPLLAGLAEPSPDPGSPVPRAGPALCAHDQGPHIHADRRDRGRAHDLAAGDSGRRAGTGTTAVPRSGHRVHVPARLPRFGFNCEAFGASPFIPRHVEQDPPRRPPARAADHVRHRSAGPT